jgi:hypothetical protein
MGKSIFIARRKIVLKKIWVKGEIFMPNPNSMKADNNNKKEDGKFKKVNKKHNPQAESTRAVFGDTKDQREF